MVTRRKPSLLVLRALPLCLTVCLATVSGWSHAETLEGRVVEISDGDTLTLLDSEKRTHKIRLSGIDAPEKDQPFGQRSKQHLASEVFGQFIVVDHHKKDRYGRLLGKLLKNGEDINLKQIQVGLAWHYKAYAKEQSARDQTQYSDAEVQARQAIKGLWGDAIPMPPWEWRHGKRRQRGSGED